MDDFEKLAKLTTVSLFVDEHVECYKGKGIWKDKEKNTYYMFPKLPKPNTCDGYYIRVKIKFPHFKSFNTVEEAREFVDEYIKINPYFIFIEQHFMRKEKAYSEISFMINKLNKENFNILEKYKNITNQLLSNMLKLHDKDICENTECWD